MYLHLGSDVIVKNRDIIAIFDMETATISKHTRKFLSECEKKGIVINISEDIPKSFILCQNNEKKLLYISQISSATLLKRANSKKINI